MSAFIVIVVENTQHKDTASFADLAQHRFGVGCRVEMGPRAYRISGLDYPISTVTTLVNVYDTPESDAACHLAIEENWADDADTQVPKLLDERVRLFCGIVLLVLKYFSAPECVLVFSAGGYVYNHSSERIDRLFSCMMQDIELDDFLGHAYTVKA